MEREGSLSGHPSRSLEEGCFPVDGIGLWCMKDELSLGDQDGNLGGGCGWDCEERWSEIVGRRQA